MKEWEVVEPKPGVQDARCGRDALAYNERLAISCLPRAQAVLRNLQILEQSSGESHIAVKAWNVTFVWQAALQQGGDQVAGAFKPDRVGIHRIVSQHGSEFAQAGIGHARHS